MPSIKFDTSDILDLADRYEGEGNLTGNTLWFVCDLLNVSSDTLLENIRKYRESN